MLTELTGSSAVVLGGTKGIGRAAVKKLAHSGASVVIQGRDEAAAQALIEECSAFAGKRIFVNSDLLTYDGIERAVEEAVTRFGKVDIVVASGGPRDPKPKLFVDMAPDEGIACLTSRLMPRLNAVHAATKFMREQKYGKIVLITTDAARTPTSIMILTRALGAELEHLGIRINSVATTLTTGTPAHDRFLAARDAGSQEVIVKAFTKAEQRVKFKLNTAEDLAEYILYLSSKESDQVSGSTLSINGGLSFPGY